MPVHYPAGRHGNTCGGRIIVTVKNPGKLTQLEDDTELIGWCQLCNARVCVERSNVIIQPQKLEVPNLREEATSAKCGCGGTVVVPLDRIGRRLLRGNLKAVLGVCKNCGCSQKLSRYMIITPTPLNK